MDEAGHRNLVEILSATGNAARAAAAHARFVTRFRSTFEEDPSPEFLRLADRLDLTIAATEQAPGAASEMQVEGAEPASDLTAAFDAHRARLRGSNRRLVTAGIAAIAAVALTAIAATVSVDADRNSDLLGERVAVFPFVVHGQSPSHDLHTALATLLSLALDGADSLVSIEPQTVLRTLPGSGDIAVDASRASALSRRLGARLFVVGEAVQSSGRLRLATSLYDRRRGAAPVARAGAEGDSGELFTLVDALARQLLASRNPGERGRAIGLAAINTMSLPAFKAYVEGETAMRRRQAAKARDLFRRAIALDSNFALAHYRLALTEFLAFRTDSAIAAANRALRLEGRLPEQRLILMRGLAAFLSGDADGAERHYRTVLSSDSMNLDAWYLLGELLHHRNPPRGRSMVESREPFTRMLAFDSSDSRAIWHLARIAALGRNSRALDTLLQRVDPKSDDALRARTLRAFALGSVDDQVRVIGELRLATSSAVFVAVEEIAVLAHDLNGAERVARVLTEPGRSADERTLGLTLVAYLEAAQGRWSAARRLIGDESRVVPRALATAALLAGQPFAPHASSERRAIRSRLQARELARAPRSDTAMVRKAAYLEAYLAGLLSVRLHEPSVGLTHAARLNRLADRAEASRVARSLAREISASVAREDSGAAAGLRELTANELAWWRDELPFPFQSGSVEQFLRAEWLRELGRDDEALRWYSTIGEESLESVLYVAPARLRQAEIEARRGDNGRAAAYYERFIALWQNADDTFEPEVARARDWLSTWHGKRSER